MNWRGIDFSPGLSSLGKTMAEGYKDMLELAQKQQVADFQAPRESVMPLQWAQAVSNPESALASFLGSGREASSERAPDTVYNQDRHQWETVPVPGRATSVPTTAPAKNGKRPASEDEVAIPVTFDSQERAKRDAQSAANQGVDQAAFSQRQSQDNAANVNVHEIARNLGLRVNEDGQLVGPGARVKSLMDLYEKVIGSAASAYALGGRLGGGGYKGQVGSGSRAGSKDQALEVVLKAKVAELGQLQRKQIADPTDIVDKMRLQREIKQIGDQIQRQGVGINRQPKSVDEDPSSSPQSMQKAYSPSQNKTYIFDAQGAVIGVEDGDVR